MTTLKKLAGSVKVGDVLRDGTAVYSVWHDPGLRLTYINDEPYPDGIYISIRVMEKVEER